MNLTVPDGGSWQWTFSHINQKILGIHLNPTEGLTQLIQENSYIFERFTCSLAPSKPGGFFALTQKKSAATQAALPSPHSVSLGNMV